MESLSYSVKLESGHQWKVHVDHLVHQAPGCVPISSEPVPMITGEEPSLKPESRMVPNSAVPRSQPLNTSEPLDCDMVTLFARPLTPRECGTVGPQKQQIHCQSSRTFGAPDKLINNYRKLYLAK